MSERIVVARHWQRKPLIGAKLTGIPQSLATPFMLGRTDHRDPFLRYLSGNEFRGWIGEVAKSQAHFSPPHHIAHLETVSGTQLEARIAVPGGEAPQLFHDGGARQRSNDRK